MEFTENKSQWNVLGRLDPFWAMTGTNKHGTWDINAFLHTGDQQVRAVLQDIHQLGRPSQRDAVLDFGCGVGRLAHAFHAHFNSYLGLDISDSLIAKARELHTNLPNARFEVNAGKNLNLKDDSFDLVYSWAVLQHISDRTAALGLLTELTRVLRQDGLLIFSAMDKIAPLYRLQPRRRLYALLKAVGFSDNTLYHQLKLYPQSAHYIPQREVTAHLEAIQAKILRIRPDVPPSAPHQVRVYYVSK
jgi:ubiquinone/menaquinone biosynthesis C-methylase UbiE